MGKAILGVGLLPRVVALLVSLSVVACERADKAEVRPSDTLALAANEGIIVGVVVIAETPDTSPGMGLKSDDIYLSYQHSGLRQFPLTPLSRTPDRAEQGAMVHLRPFAYRLPAGPGNFQALELRRIDFKTVTQRQYYYDAVAKRSDWRDIVVRIDRIDNSIHEAVSPARFTVEPGRITYVGRIGLLFRVTTHGMQLSERDKTCSPRYRQGTVFGARCVVWQLLVGNAPDVDLPLIRRTFPNLPPGEIDQRPLAPAPGSWMQLPEALQSIKSFR